MKLSEKLRQGLPGSQYVPLQTPQSLQSLNNGTVPGGMAYAFGMGMEGLMRGEHQRGQIEAHERDQEQTQAILKAMAGGGGVREAFGLTEGQPLGPNAGRLATQLAMLDHRRRTDREDALAAHNRDKLLAEIKAGQNAAPTFGDPRQDAQGNWGQDQIGPDGRVTGFVPVQGYSVPPEPPKGAPPADPPPPGPEGTGTEAWAIRTLLRGDPASPEYAAAYGYIGAPRQSHDRKSGQLITITPDMSAYRPPVTPAPMADAPPPMGTQGVLADYLSGYAARTQPGQSVPNNAGGVTVEQVTDPAKMTTIQSATDQVSASLQRYRAAVAEHGIELMPGRPSAQLRAMHTDLMMQYKNLYELGALQQPDIDILTRLIPDPTDWGSAFESGALIGRGQESMLAQLDEASALLQQRLAVSQGAPITAPEVDDPLGLLSPPAPRQGLKD